MPDDVGLLLHAVACEGLTWFQDIAVSAKRVAREREVDAALLLPDTDEIVDQQRLHIDTFAVAQAVEFWMEPDVPVGAITAQPGGVGVAWAS